MAQQNKDEQIGFHKGSLATLAKERQEMIRLLNIVEQLMQMHIAGLKELGIDLAKEAQAENGENQKGFSTSRKPEGFREKPIEDILNKKP